MSQETLEPEAQPEQEINPKTGLPYVRPRAWREAQSRSQQARWKGTSPPPKTQKARSKKQAEATDYQTGFLLLLGMPIMILRMLGNFFPALAKDAAALVIHGGSLAKATNDAAQTNPRIAAALDRMLAVGPYSEIVGVATVIGLQVAANHGKIPAEPRLGIMTEEQLAEQLEKMTPV